MSDLTAADPDVDSLVRRITALVPVRDHEPAPGDGWLDGADEKLRALLEHSTAQGLVRRLDVLDELRKTVVRLELWEVRGVGPSLLGPRIWVRGLRGYDAEREALEAQLTGELGCTPARTPLPNAAWRAAGGDPDALGSKLSVPLAGQTRSDAAAARVLRALAAVIEANLEGTVEDLHPEFLHDLRVSVRRTRAVQRELKAVFPPAELARMRREFKWLQNATGELRDLDVQLEELGELRDWVGSDYAGDLGPVGAVLAERRRGAQAAVAQTLRGRRVRRLLREWGALLEELVELPLEGRERATEPIVTLAGERIAKVYRRMVRDGRRIGSDSPDEDLHELRKRGKELRYLLELFGTQLFPAETVDPLVSTLKKLQDTLGRHQDRHVQITRLRELGPELVGRDGGDAALIAVGVALRALREDAHGARTEFAKRFERFAAREVRRTVRRTFAP